MDEFYGSHVVNISCMNPIGILVSFWNSPPPPPKLMGLGFSTKTALTLEFLTFWRFLNNEIRAKMQAVHRPKHWMYEPKNPFLCPIRKVITPIYMFLFWGWDVSTINATEGFGFLGCRKTRIKNTQKTIPKYYLTQKSQPMVVPFGWW